MNHREPPAQPPSDSSDERRASLAPARRESVYQGSVTHVSSFDERSFRLSAYCGLRLHVRSIAKVVVLGMLMMMPQTCGAQPIEEGELTAGEDQFLRRTIYLWGFTDIARTYIDERSKRTSGDGRADCEYFLADCLKIEGRADEYASEIERLRRKYPSHRRSKAAGVEVIKANFLKVLTAHQDAMGAESAQRKGLFEKRDQLYASEVEEPLETTISALNEEVKQLEIKVSELQQAKKSSEGEEQLLHQKRSLRDEAEHYRVIAARVFAERMAPGTPEHSSRWQQVATFAQKYVDERWEDFARQCECQLIYSIALSRLGRTEEAADTFETLVEITPPADPPYPDVVVRFIRGLRLQAAAGTAAAYNGAGRPEAAVELFNRLLANQDKNFPIDGAEDDPNLAAFKVAMEVEEAIARTAGADGGAGIDKFRTLLERYQRRTGEDSSAASNRLEVAQGLSRLLDLGAGRLPAILYRNAGAGYQVRGMFEEAIFAFKRGLEQCSGSRDDDDIILTVDLMNQIGQTYLLVGEAEQAGLAFLMACEGYSGQKVGRDQERVLESGLALASQNAFATLADLTGVYPDSGWKKLLASAELLFAENNTGRGAEALKLQQGAEFEDKAEYTRAQERYATVRKKIDDEWSDLYFQGKTSEARVVFLDRKAAGESARGIEQATALLKKLEGELSEFPTALREEGQVLISLTLGTIHWDPQVHDAPTALAAFQPLASAVAGGGGARELALQLWTTILIESDDPDTADVRFAELQSKFPASEFLLPLSTDLIQAHLARGEDRNLKRAAELASFFVKHPEAKLDQLDPSVLLYFANAMVEGGRTTEAAPLLARAQKALEDATDNADLDIAVTLLLAKVKLHGGDASEAVTVLEELEKRHPEEVRQGTVPDGPYVLWTRARARLAMHEKRPSAELLAASDQDLQGAVAVLQQRRQAMILNGQTVPAGMDKDYWSGWLELLKVWKAQKQHEKLVKWVNVSIEAAPDEFKTQFEQLRKESQR